MLRLLPAKGLRDSHSTWTTFWGAFQQITYGYDSQGNLSLITSLDGNGNIVNQVQEVYNGLGQLTADYQSHSGAVVQGSTPVVQYAYNEMANGENNSRLVSMTYPDGYVLDYNYNSGLDDSISRLSSISDSTDVLESYKYLGLDTVVERDHPQIDVNQTYISQNGQTGAAGDQYVGLDQFGQVVNDNWVNTNTGESTDDFAYGYDEDGDVLYQQNLVDTAMSQLYQYNNLNELIGYAQGTLNSTDTGIVGTPSASQSWDPDALGNFDSVTTNGNTQTETSNQQNEITGISGSGTISYDANGNLTADGSGNTYVYDAWNQLVAVQNNGTTVAAYSYDGLGRRITETEGGTTTDLYYSSADQVLEEDVGGEVQAQNVWSPVYVNALVLRDQSSQHNGMLDQRLYVQQDANWNVTALVDTSGNVVERYAYDPYGAVTVLNPDFSVRGSSSYAMPYLWQGERYDWAVNLYHTETRDVSPSLMRPLQADYLGLGPDINDYRWEGDGPIDAVDPTGEDCYYLMTRKGSPIAEEWGHAAILIGPDKFGRYYFFSYSTGKDLRRTDDNIEYRVYNSLKDFNNEKDSHYNRYKYYLHFAATDQENYLAWRYMHSVGRRTSYKFLRHNCGQIAIDAIEYALPDVSLNKHAIPKKNYLDRRNRRVATGWGTGKIREP